MSSTTSTTTSTTPIPIPQGKQYRLLLRPEPLHNLPYVLPRMHRHKADSPSRHGKTAPYLPVGNWDIPQRQDAHSLGAMLSLREPSLCDSRERRADQGAELRRSHNRPRQGNQPGPQGSLGSMSIRCDQTSIQPRLIQRRISAICASTD